MKLFGTALYVLGLKEATDSLHIHSLMYIYDIEQPLISHIIMIVGYRYIGGIGKGVRTPGARWPGAVTCIIAIRRHSNNPVSYHGARRQRQSLIIRQKTAGKPGETTSQPASQLLLQVWKNRSQQVTKAGSSTKVVTAQGY